MAITYSGVDPARITGMVEQLVGFKKNMIEILDDIKTVKISDIRANYEGNAADAVIARTESLCTQCTDILEEIVKTISTDINRDLDDYAKTDANLAGN